ncbi:MAG: transcriptional regulator PpsR [Pseudomonadales bacterium]
MELLADEFIDPASAARLAQAASDIALILDGNGVVLDVIVRDADLAEAMQGNWRGRPWIETVTSESREKVELLLQEARDLAEPTWRQINHLTGRSDFDRPVRYCAMKMNGDDRYLALGRDLHTVAELQQRLIDAQETTERDYWRLRQAESRFRLLFQVTSDAVMVVEAENLRIMEANPSAEQALGWERGPGNSRLLSYFTPEQGKVVQSTLNRAQSTGHAEASDIVLLDSERRWSLSASALRYGNTAVFILRMTSAADAASIAQDPESQRILRLVEDAPDAIVITNEAGRILSVNHAFAEFAELASDTQALGSQLAEWLGRSSVDVNVLLANLKKNGRIRLFNTSLTSAHQVATDVEVSAVTISEGGDTCFGFIIRSTAQRIADSGVGSNGSSRSVEQLTELVGSVPLKELVRESADLIERLSIEAALKLTNGNRAAAAEMLGLSRQSLYVKLRRYDLGDKSQDSNGD